LPLKIYSGYLDEDENVINIPEDYKLEYLPKNTTLTTKFGTYNVSFKKINETQFIYKKSISINEGIYSKEDYSVYRSFRRSIAKLENQRIALIKK